MKRSKELGMWNRKAFSYVPPVFALMVGLLGAGGSAATAAPTIDLNGPDVAAGNYTSEIWVNLTDLNPPHVALAAPDAFVSETGNVLQQMTVKLGDGNPATAGDSPDGGDERIEFGAASYGNVQVVMINAHSYELNPIVGTTASVTDFRDAIRDSYYDNRSINEGASEIPTNPSSVTAGNRTVTFSAVGSSGTGTATTTVPVDSDNDPPVVAPAATTASFVEQGDLEYRQLMGVAVFPSGSVTEPEDQIINRMSFELTGRVDHDKRNDSDQTANAVERLFFQADGGGGIGGLSPGSDTGSFTVTIGQTTRSFSYNYGPSTGVMDVTGNATDAFWGIILRTLRYNNTSLDPTETDRQVIARAFDIEKGSLAAVSTISVTKRNNTANIVGPGSAVVSGSGANHTVALTYTISDVDDETFNGTPIPNQVVDYGRAEAAGAASTDPYIEMTIGVSHGIISLDNSEGAVPKLKFTYGSNNSANMIFYGRQQDINEAIGGLVFTSDESYTDNALLTVRVNDQANTGDGGFRNATPIWLTLIGPGTGSGAIPRISLDGEAPLDVNGDATASSGWTTTFVFGANEIKVTDTDAFLSDKDHNINKIVVSIAGANDGASENLNAPPFDASKVLISYDPDTKILTLTKTATGTEADLQTVLRTITYNNASTNPSGTGRTITFVVSDSAGNSDSAATIIDYDSGGPELNLDPDNSSGGPDDGDFTKTYVPGGPAVQVVDSDVTVTDPDGVVTSATLDLRTVDNPNDEFLLVDTSGTGITANYNPTTGTLTLTGVDSDANYRQVIASVRYSNVAQSPTNSPRIIDITVSDNANSDTKTATLIADGSEPPSSTTINLDADNSSGVSPNYRTFWNQGGQTVLADTDAFVDETDNSIQKITVTIANDTRRDGVNEILSTGVTVAGITPTYDQATGTLTLQGPASEAAFITALRSVRYQNTYQPEPNGDSRDFRFDVYGNSNNTITATASTTISLTDPTDPTVDDAGTTVVDLNGNDSTGVDYQGPWDQAAQTRLVDTDAFVTNDAAPQGNGTLRKITVTILDRQDDINEVLTATSAANVTATFDSASGVLTLQGQTNGRATAAEFQNVLRTVRYRNNAAVINGTSRSFLFTAEGGLAPATAQSNISTAPAGGAGTTTLDLDADNSSQDLDPDNNVTVFAGGYLAIWDQAATTNLVDTDAMVSNTEGTLTKITVTITNRQDDLNEVLSATGIANVLVTYDAPSGVLTLQGQNNGRATSAEFQNVLRTVAYKNNSATPNGTSRTFEFRAFGGINEPTAQTIISTSFDSGPVTGPGVSDVDLDADDSTGTPNGSKDYFGLWNKATTNRIVDTDARVTNLVPPLNTTGSLTKITVTILNPQDDISEVLSATAVSNVTVEYDAPSGVLTLTGTNNGAASPAEFQNVLRSVLYKNTAATPTGDQRQFEIRVFGGTNEPVALSTISTDVIGTPAGLSEIDLNGDNAAGVNVTRKWEFGVENILADSDAWVKNSVNSIQKITVTINNRQDGLSEELLATPAGAVTVNYDSVEGVLTLQGPATPAEFQNVVRSVRYKNQLATPSGTTREFTFLVFGGVEDPQATATARLNRYPEGSDGSDVDTDGDGINDDEDTDDDGDGIPDDQDADTPGGGNDGDDDNSMGGYASRIDLNGAAAGYNYKTKWDRGNPVKLAADDAMIHDTDGDVDRLVITIVGGGLDVGEAIQASATGLTSTSASGMLTLQGPASRETFEAALRSVVYTNPNPSGKTRRFRFDLYGKVTGTTVDEVTSVAYTTIDINDSGNGNNKLFNGFVEVSGNTAKLTYRVRNITGAPLNNVLITGNLAGGRPINDNATITSVTPNDSTVSSRWNHPRSLGSIMDMSKAGKGVRWFIPSLPHGEEAVLVITVPLRNGGYGDKLTTDWSADFTGQARNETVDPLRVP